LILTQQIVIAESPITKWCAGNAAVKPDEFGNRYLIKKHSRGRIDGMASGAMSVGCALFEPESGPQPMMFFLGAA
jgi:phage terminase large subunit-like protein